MEEQTYSGGELPALADHWRRQLKLRHRWMALLAAGFDHHDAVGGPSTSGVDRPPSTSPSSTRGLGTRVGSSGPTKPSAGERPSAPATGKRPLRKSPRAGSGSAKRAKTSVSSGVTSKKMVHKRSGVAASPLAPTSSDVTHSSDSEPVREALARSRSSRRRPNTVPPPAPAAAPPPASAAAPPPAPAAALPPAMLLRFLSRSQRSHDL